MFADPSPARHRSGQPGSGVHRGWRGRGSQGGCCGASPRARPRHVPNRFAGARAARRRDPGQGLRDPGSMTARRQSPGPARRRRRSRSGSPTILRCVSGRTSGWVPPPTCCAGSTAHSREHRPRQSTRRHIDPRSSRGAPRAAASAPSPCSKHQACVGGDAAVPRLPCPCARDRTLRRDRICSWLTMIPWWSCCGGGCRLRRTCSPRSQAIRR